MFELSAESNAVRWSGSAAGIDGVFPSKLSGLAAFFLLVVSVTAATGGGVACEISSELSCSEVATSEVDTLLTGAWLDGLATETSMGSEGGVRAIGILGGARLAMTLRLYFSGG